MAQAQTQTRTQTHNLSETSEPLTAKATELVAQMTLEEKASVCSGENFWQLKAVSRFGLQAIMVTDGPHGLRKQGGDSDHLGLNDSVPATCFPTASALASSWDVSLLESVGVALGKECVAEDVAVLLGPGINIKRHPLCGRNFEYFSEDPLLTGQLAAGMIRGVQSQGVGSCLKHFAVNNQETNRMIVDAVVDERSLREIYLRGFEIAIDHSQPWTVMSAYNRLNGAYCSDNHWLLTQVLRDDWGFQGLVMSDWMGCNHRVDAIRAGMDLEMPGNGGQTDQQIIEAIQQGDLSTDTLDQVATRIVRLHLQALQRPALSSPVDFDAHHQLARSAACRSAVLLKNNNQVLPLRSGQRLAVIGEFAKQPRVQGSGSSKVKSTRCEVAFGELTLWAQQHPGTDVCFAAGYCPVSSSDDNGLIDEAIAVAQAADVAVVFAGLPEIFEAEASDRTGLSLPEQHQRLIKAVAATGTPTVVVLSNGAPVAMDWLDNVDALLEAYLTGQASGGAIADLLTGTANPSGKLAETFPLKQSDVLSDVHFPGDKRQVQYREGLYVGYRYFNTVNKAVQFPFGFGLSYSSFIYQDFELQGDPQQEPLRVQVTIQNESERDGEEIVQVYVSCDQSYVHRPKQQLAGYAKIKVAAGWQLTVDITLDPHAFDYYDVDSQRWRKNPGDYRVEIGSSSRDIHLSQVVTIEDASQHSTAKQSDPETDFFQALVADAKNIPDEIFTRMLRRPIPAVEPSQPFTINSTLSDMKQTRLGRKIASGFEQKMLEQSNIDHSDESLVRVVKQVMENMPLRAMALASNGQFSFKMLNILIHCLNHRFGKALLTMLRQ
ncbi:glycoside hydrolase family 3 C-terminal domain-containing protein [Pseudomaricurvus sp.]|uniref:glycoside hydrolase family 3 C-terminal domain-containing protein n=1 Tax=Pseudomaricurvus sp. TaxID=2004510 RepID=UPI003F6B6A6D